MGSTAFIASDNLEKEVSPTWPLPVSLFPPTAASSAGFSPSVSFLRTADTVTYAAGDVVGAASAVLTLTTAGPAGGYVYITDATMQYAATAVPSGMTSFRGHLYDTAPAQIVDNAAWDLTGADTPYYLGYVDFGTPVDVGSNLYVQTTQVNKTIKLAAASSSIWIELVTNGAFLPASATSIQLKLRGFSA